MDKSEPLANRVVELTGGRGVDRIIEMDLGANAVADLEMLRPGGECVVYGSSTSALQLSFYSLIAKNLQLKFFIVYYLTHDDRARAIATLTRLLARGGLKHNIAARLPLEEIAAANEMVERGAATGKVALSID